MKKFIIASAIALAMTVSATAEENFNLTCTPTQYTICGNKEPCSPVNNPPAISFSNLIPNKPYSFLGDTFNITLKDSGIDALNIHVPNKDMTKGDVNFFSINRYTGRFYYIKTVNSGRLVVQINAQCVPAQRQF